MSSDHQTKPSEAAAEWMAAYGLSADNLTALALLIAVQGQRVPEVENGARALHDLACAMREMRHA